MGNQNYIRIVLNPVGVEKVELFAIPDDSNSQALTVALYKKLAIAIHQFSQCAKLILDSSESTENEAPYDCYG